MTELLYDVTDLTVDADTAMTASPVSVSGESSSVVKKLDFVMPKAEYNAGCTATALGMLLSYYDCYGYNGYDFSGLIANTAEIDVYSRYTGNALNGSGADAYYSVSSIYDMSNSSTLDQFIADGAKTESSGYYARFWDKTAEQEYPYTFATDEHGDLVKTSTSVYDSSTKTYVNADLLTLNTGGYSCLADWLGTGQLGRGKNADTATSYFYGMTLKDIKDYPSKYYTAAQSWYTYKTTITGSSTTVYVQDAKYIDFLYGLELYANANGYQLDNTETKNVQAKTEIQSSGTYTYEDLMAEIDAGRPLLLQLNSTSGGHTVIAYGYDYDATTDTRKVLVDDTYVSDRWLDWDAANFSYGSQNYYVSAVSQIVFSTSGLSERTGVYQYANSAYISHTAASVSDLTLTDGELTELSVTTATKSISKSDVDDLKAVDAVVVEKNGSVSNITLNEGTALTVNNGGNASGITLNDGASLTVNDGAAVSGALSIHENISTATGIWSGLTSLDVYLSDFVSGSSEMIIGDLSKFANSLVFTIHADVTSLSSELSYLLGENTFGGTITISDGTGNMDLTSESPSGTLNGVKYALGSSAGQTTLSIGDVTPPAAPILELSTTEPTRSLRVLPTFSEDTVSAEYSTDNVQWQPYDTEDGVLVETENTTVYFRAKDLSGNTSAVSSITASNVDRTAPDDPIVTSTPAADVHAYTVKLTVSGNEENLTFEYSEDNENWSLMPEDGFSFSENHDPIWFRSTDLAGNISNAVSYTVSNIVEVDPVSLLDDLTEYQGNTCIVEISKDNFETSVKVKTSSLTDAFAFSALNENAAWRILSAEGTEIAGCSGTLTKPESCDGPQLIRSRSSQNPGNEIFLLNEGSTWNQCYRACHTGYKYMDGSDVKFAQGTNEIVELNGMNRYVDMIDGSENANILLLTDDENGDALIYADAFSQSVGSAGRTQMRFTAVNEIWLGAGDDLLDMTSTDYTYDGTGVTARGGDGDDVIWANVGENQLFGDAGDDSIIGGLLDDLICGGDGNDVLNGGGGDDLFCFCYNWNRDSVVQSAGGTVTLWFADGITGMWDEATSTFTSTDGTCSVTVSGTTEITLKFGTEDENDAEEYARLADLGAFSGATTKRIWETGTSLA